MWNNVCSLIKACPLLTDPLLPLCVCAVTAAVCCKYVTALVTWPIRVYAYSSLPYALFSCKCFVYWVILAACFALSVFAASYFAHNLDTKSLSSVLAEELCAYLLCATRSVPSRLSLDSVLRSSLLFPATLVRCWHLCTRTYDKSLLFSCWR